MLWTTSDDNLNAQASRNKKNQDITAGAGDASDDGRVGRSIKNLLSAAKSAKSKKPKLTKPKKLDLVKAQNLAKTHSSGTDFLTLGAKEAFIHLRKAFTKAPILRHFDPECHIWIETDASGYAIGGVLSQMTLDHSDQLSSDHVTYKNLNPIFFKSKIGQ